MAEMREALVLEDRFTAAFNRYITLAEQGTASTQELNDAAVQASKNARLASAAYETAAMKSSAAAAAAREQAAQTAALAAQERLEAQRVREAARAQNENAAAQNKTADATQALTGRIKSLVGAYVGLQTVQKLVETSDQMTQINARLQLMTGSAEAAADAQDKIYQAAQRSRGAYMDMADMVAQLGTLAPDAFSSTDELIAFAEQLQKQMAISGASGQSAQAAMVQLTQALASGTLRGDELNSVLEQTPMIAKTIADYMGVTTGQMREMASEGAITADVVKNAMLSAAAETDAAYEQMPLTWSQVWTMGSNMALQAMQPVLDLISLAANNTERLIPIVTGLAAAVTVYAGAQTAANAATWLGVAANRALVASMLANPFLWVAVAVGVAVAAIAVWVQSVGGVQVAWLTAVDVVLSGVDNLRIGIYTGMYAIQNKFGEFGLAAFTMGVNVVNFFGDMKVGALEQIQGMANGAIDIINWMIEKVNLLPGVSIDAIDKLTFASTAAAANEAAKASRADALAKSQAAVAKQEADRAANLNKMRSDAYSAHMQRQVGIYNAKLDAAGASGTSAGGLYDVPAFDEMAGTLGDIGKDVKGIKKSVDLSNEDVKMLVDVAARRYVNQVNLTSQTPVITINGQNTGNTKEDMAALESMLKTVLAEQWAAGGFRAAARPI